VTLEAIAPVAPDPPDPIDSPLDDVPETSTAVMILTGLGLIAIGSRKLPLQRIFNPRRRRVDQKS